MAEPICSLVNVFLTEEKVYMSGYHLFPVLLRILWRQGTYCGGLFRALSACYSCVTLSWQALHGVAMQVFIRCQPLKFVEGTGTVNKGTFRLSSHETWKDESHQPAAQKHLTREYRVQRIYFLGHVIMGTIRLC